MSSKSLHVPKSPDNDDPPPGTFPSGGAARPAIFTQTNAIASANDSLIAGRISAPIPLPSPANDSVQGPQPLHTEDLKRLTAHFPIVSHMAIHIHNNMAVVCIDQAGFGQHALFLQNRLGSAGVLATTFVIRALVLGAMKAFDLPEDRLIKLTGDGAYILAPAEKAAALGKAIIEAFQGYNEAPPVIDGKPMPIEVRVGVAASTVAFGGGEYGGMAFVLSNRLQAGSPGPGTITIDGPTWRAAPDDVRAAFQGPWTLRGKGEERFMVFTARTGEGQPRPARGRGRRDWSWLGGLTPRA